MTNNAAAKPETSKLYMRGLITNSFGGLILWAIAAKLQLSYYVKLSCGLQLAVFLLHGEQSQSASTQSKYLCVPQHTILELAALGLQLQQRSKHS
jgi:hypothetical protein